MDISSQQLAAKLVPQLPGLRLDRIEIAHDIITINLTTSAPMALCPLCATTTTQIHSSYARTLADLPWAGYMVRLQLTIRKFFCKLPYCVRLIFTERVPDFVASYARRTARLAQILTLVGLALGGQGGSRLVARLGVAVSSSTVLRHLRRATVPLTTVPRVLGIDDFAFRKGRTYGTILVDLEQHRPIELLPDRTAETLAEWLRKHPGVQVISRDRSTEYIRGVTLGAPHAQQIADRFHIVKNLREAVERLLDRNRSRFRGIELPRSIPSRRSNQSGQSGQGVPPQAQRRPASRTAVETTILQARKATRQALYEQVRTLHAAGQSMRKIGEQVGISRGTVFHYLRSDSDPTATQMRVKRSILDPYLPYLYERLQGGCENGVQMWREIKIQGYPGSRKMVAIWVAQQRTVPAKTGPLKYRDWDTHSLHSKQGKEHAEQAKQRTPSSRQLSYFLLRDPESQSTAQKATLKQLQEICPDVEVSYPLVWEFLQMVRKHTGEELDNWISKVAASKLIDLQSFATGLERDKAAVLAGLREDWSQGQVEGQVNRLKLKKREMYGRAKFDLLRKRVLNLA